MPVFFFFYYWGIMKRLLGSKQGQQSIGKWKGLICCPRHLVQQAKGLNMIVRTKNILKNEQLCPPPPPPKTTFTHIRIICHYDFEQMCVHNLPNFHLSDISPTFTVMYFERLQKFSHCVRGEMQMNVAQEKFTSDPVLSIQPSFKPGKGVQCGGPCPWPKPYRKPH